MKQRLSWAAFTPLALGLTLACDGAPAKPAAADAVYSVRGQVVETSGQGPGTRAMIAHEAIADFKDRDGKPGAMGAMTMAFGVAPQVDPKSLVPGSKWRLGFEVRWNEEPALLITSAQALPPDTPLTLAP